MDAFKVRFLCTRGRRTLMADIVSPEKRSQNMSAIRSKNTKPEVYLRKLLFAQGYRYRIADKSVPGHPDIFLRKYNTAVFVNGCFWHRHSGCKYAYMPKSRVDFWQKKFDDNVRRDAAVKAELLERGIKCLIVWECTIKQMMKNDAESMSSLEMRVYSLVDLVVHLKKETGKHGIVRSVDEIIEYLYDPKSRQCTQHVLYRARTGRLNRCSPELQRRLGMTETKEKKSCAE